MARIEIESAFIEPWTRNQDEHPAWGMKTAEPHSRKNNEGKFETIARTYRTVKVSRDSGIDLSLFVKGDRVQVWGREVTEVREHEGKKFYDLVLWADRVERAEMVAAATERGQGATNTAPGDSDTSSEVWGAQTGAQQNTSSEWPTAEIPDNPWPDDETTPF